jgi:hypothetical protein
MLSICRFRKVGHDLSSLSRPFPGIRFYLNQLGSSLKASRVLN